MILVLCTTATAIRTVQNRCDADAELVESLAAVGVRGGRVLVIAGGYLYHAKLRSIPSACSHPPA